MGLWFSRRFCTGFGWGFGFRIGFANGPWCFWFSLRFCNVVFAFFCFRTSFEMCFCWVFCFRVGFFFLQTSKSLPSHVVGSLVVVFLFFAQVLFGFLVGFDFRTGFAEVFGGFLVFA